MSNSACTHVPNHVDERSRTARSNSINEYGVPHTRRVVTLTEPALRSKIDLVANSAFLSIHTQSIQEAYREAKTLCIGTLLISPNVLSRTELPAIRQLLQACPGISTVAIVAERSSHTDDTLLMFGACGIRNLINVSEREGMRALRNVAASLGEGVARAVLTRLQPILSQAPPKTERFFVQLLRLAPTTATTKALSRSIGVNPQTMSSRFFRVGLPSPRTYLTMFRLLYVAAFLEDASISVASVSRCLQYSSPQSLSRQVRLVLGMTPAELRTHGFVSLLARVINQQFAPFKRELHLLTSIEV